ncbi:aromatic prenyltransferase [Actinomadura welshii]
MPGTTETEKVYSAIEESARMLDVPFSRDKVWPILTTFGEALGENLVVLGVQTGERHAGELDYSFAAPPSVGDPYPYARSKGFVAETDHPVGSLLSDIHAHIPVREYGIDCGVVTGFRKFYAHFPHDLQKLSKLTDIPSMPHAVAENAGLFARYGLDDVAMIGVNYEQRTMSVYFQFGVEGQLEPKAIRSMLREIGLHEPDNRTLEYVHRTMRANFTFGWESSKITRVALAPPPRRGLDLAALPTRLAPHIARFATSAPRVYGGERVNLFAAKWSADEEMLEICSYYRLSPIQERLLATHREEPA